MFSPRDILLDASENLRVEEDEGDNWNDAGEDESAPVLVIPEVDKKKHLNTASGQ